MLHNQPSSDIRTSIIECEKKLKMMSISMGGILWTPLCHYLFLSALMENHMRQLNPSSTMTIFGTFVQSSITLEDEKEDQVVRD